MGHGRPRHRRRHTPHRRTLTGIAGLLAAALVAVVVVRQEAPSAASNPAPAAIGALAGTAVPAGAHVPNGAVTVSPAPGSRTADPATQLSFLGRPVADLGTITVTGSSSGVHLGRLLPYSTGDGASFVPDQPFVAGETVTVHTSLPIAGASSGTYQFVVADVVPLTAGPHPPPLRTDVAGVDHFASAPALQPPTVTVDARHGALPSGSWFLAPKGTTGQAGPMIVRPDGQLVWFDPMPAGQEAFDLKEQTLHGRSVLTWFQGEVVAGHGQGEVVIANRSYHVIAVVHGGNGTLIDLHDLQLTNRGTLFVTAYRTMRWNLSGDGGSTTGTVFDGVIQEIDVKTGLVEEEWDSLDHVPVSASDFRAPANPAVPFDYFHVNGVQPLAGGDLLVSSRNTSAAYLVDPADAGDIVWTLGGGTTGSFTMGAGARFYFEHDVRLHRGNLVTIFDNASSPPREPASRALFLHLDLATHTATVVHAFISSAHHVLAYALGNVEPLRNGEVAVGWGTAPSFSVFTPSGHLRYDATLPVGDDSYRAYLVHWTGAPTTRPAVAVTTSSSGTSVAMSWNGATDVARWRLLTGSGAGALHAVATVADTGFETVAHLTSVGTAVQVEALGARGRLLGRSAVVTPSPATTSGSASASG